jgi:hypothetical protein
MDKKAKQAAYFCRFSIMAISTTFTDSSIYSDQNKIYLNSKT